MVLNQVQVVITLSLILIISTSCANDCVDFMSNVNQCYSDNTCSHHRLYGSKTTYSEARQNWNVSYDYDIPGCEPIVLYFIGRHAIRYPDAEDILEMSKVLPQLQEKIIAAKEEGKSQLCDKDIDKIKEWKMKMVEIDDNRIGDSGVHETRLIAKRFSNQLPSLLNPNKANIEVGITKKERTAETADAFIDGIKQHWKDNGKKSEDNDEDDSNSHDNSESGYESSQEGDSHENVNNFPPEKKDQPILYFHSTCKKLLKNQGVVLGKPKLVTDFQSSELMKKLLKRVNDRLGISMNVSDELKPETSSHSLNYIDFPILRNIIRACYFEYAIYGDSPWCAAFGEPELKVLEYMDDLEDFHEDAYGRNINRKQTCPLIGDLVEKLKLSVNSRQKDKDDKKKRKKRSSYLHFTHAGAMKRLYSGFGLFDQLNKPEGSPDSSLWSPSISDHESHGGSICQSDNRKWRSSLISPFNANFAAVLYKCKNKVKDDKNSDNYDDKTHDKRLNKYALLTLVNENPVIVEGCDSELCPLEIFLGAYQSMSTHCNLNEICRI